jgi:hypothetical protein
VERRLEDHFDEHPVLREIDEQGTAGLGQRRTSGGLDDSPQIGVGFFSSEQR